MQPHSVNHGHAIKPFWIWLHKRHTHIHSLMMASQMPNCGRQRWRWHIAHQSLLLCFSNFISNFSSFLSFPCIKCILCYYAAEWQYFRHSNKNSKSLFNKRSKNTPITKINSFTNFQIIWFVIINKCFNIAMKRKHNNNKIRTNITKD